MNYGPCHSVQDWLLHLVVHQGKVRSVYSTALQNGLDPYYLLICAHKLAQAGRISMERVSKNGPYVLTAKPQVKVEDRTGLVIQERLF